ncbi:MAG: alpha/beta hydrolase-fold protein, partial [Planctomycetota bacterium]
PFPMQGLALAFDNRHQDTLFTYDTITAAAVPALHRGFVLAPWGRGNGFYRDAAEADVWQSLMQVEQRFRVDADRRYVTGFSMGCHGAWRLATARPDVWAGVGLAAGFGPWSDVQNVSRFDNGRHLPVTLWCGELDRMVDACRSFAVQRAVVPAATRLTIAPNLPHTFPYPALNDEVAWLLQHERRPVPSAFAYSTREPRHPGIYGVQAKVDWLSGDVPGEQVRIACRRAGSTIHLASSGTDGLLIDCERLGVDGEVQIFWNGESVYIGAPGQIPLGEAFTPEPWYVEP